MKRANFVLQTLGLQTLALGTFIFSIAGPARAVVEPQGGQNAYEIPLQAFDLHNYRSATIDSDRSAVETAFAREYSGMWTVYSWNPQSGTPSEMYGSGVDVAGSLTSADVVRTEAEGIIRESSATLRADLRGLRFKEVTSAPPMTDSPDGIHRPGKWAAHFQQVHHGVDVVGGNVHMTFTDTGRLFALGSTYYSDISVDWNPSLSADRAKEIARDALPYDPATDSIEPDVKLLVLPVPLSETEVEHHLVWEVRVRTQEPLGIWITSVDAHGGQILQRTNDVHFVNYQGSVAGQVERLSYCDGSQQEAFPYAFVSVLGVGSTYANSSGNWVVGYGGTSSNTLFSRLASPYVDVQNAQGPYAGIFATVFPGVPYSVIFDNSNSRADERDVFRTIGDVHDFFETFAPGFAQTNQVITARVNINNSCNAFYDGTINFYQAAGGCGNTGQIMDVVAHEYGHAIQQVVLGGQDGEGLHEGNSDVTAFLMTMSSLIGRGFYDCTADGGLRDCNNMLRYPGDVVGQEVHDAGRVIAGFHWDAMQDQIADYGSWGRYSTAWDWHWGRVLQQPLTQPAQVLATFIANDNDGNLSNGTPQFNSYCLAATNHGFTCPSALLPLTASACDTYYQTGQGYTMNQQTNYWTVVGVSPAIGDDKDMSVYTAGYGAWLATSQYSEGTDFVVGDFNHNALGTYQPYVHYGSAASAFVTEWDSGSDQITLGVDINASMGGGNGNCGLVRVWDVFLTAGRTYTVGLINNGGAADMRVSLFRNPAAAPYWAGRGGAALEVQAGNSTLYTAPATDWYGVVVFNNSQGPPPTGYYTLRVQDAPATLANAVCQSSTTSPRMFGFTQPYVYWGGVAVNPSGTDDKDIAVYTDPAGASTPLATSTGTVGTDFVVGDFNHNPTGTYYSRVSYGSTSASYVTEFDGGLDVIYVGNDVNGTVGGGAGGCGLIKVSDIYLNEGQQVRFRLTTSGADIRMALFRNPSDATYWVGRGSAEFEAGNADGRTYMAPASDWYGVVVFNNSPGSPGGSYTLSVRDLPAMADAVCISSSFIPQLYSFTQATNYWTAVAINPSGADDKDVLLFDNPDGLGSSIANSTGTVGTDFVIGDFNHNIQGTYYPMATYGGEFTNHVLEWESGLDIFPMATDVDGTVGGAGGSCGLVRVWDVYLEAGTTYQIALAAVGDADVRVSLFRNPNSAPYWAGRYNAEFERQPVGTPYNYTAPATDWYGLVVFNDSPDSPAGSYTLRIDSAAGAPEQDVVDIEPGITFQNPYPAGAPMLLRAAEEGTGAQVGIYNVQGQLVRTLLNESIGTAERQLNWDGRTEDGLRLSAGIYLLHARIGSMRVNRTLLMMR